MGEQGAREVIALSLSPLDFVHECPDFEYRRGQADAILAALEAEGYTVAKLELTYAGYVIKSPRVSSEGDRAE